jgi:hypothetical protein
MGFFFRKSASFGPFRFNLSKSGMGACFGVKGARITASARGTTYITMGSHGFYYRETLTQKHQTRSSAVDPAGKVGQEPISTAPIDNLRDSSNEQLIKQLNQKATMLNPAWVIYALAGIVFVVGLSSLPNAPESTTAGLTFLLPGVTLSGCVCGLCR